MRLGGGSIQVPGGSRVQGAVDCLGGICLLAGTQFAEPGSRPGFLRLRARCFRFISIRLTSGALRQGLFGILYCPGLRLSSPTCQIVVLNIEDCPLPGQCSGPALLNNACQGVAVVALLGLPPHKRAVTPPFLLCPCEPVHGYIVHTILPTSGRWSGPSVKPSVSRRSMQWFCGVNEPSMNQQRAWANLGCRIP